MKLAKKMLASVLALAIVAAFALTAFAAAPVVSLTATEYANVGDEITIDVAATGMAGLESADLEFAYDAEVLEFVSIAKPAGAAYDMGAGGDVDGVVTWSLLFLESATADSALATLTFKVVKAGDAKVSVKYTSWEGTDMPAEASVTVSQKETTTVAPETTTKAPETTTKAPATENNIPQTGEAGVAAIAGVMALAAVAFVATRKKDEE